MRALYLWVSPLLLSLRPSCLSLCSTGTLDFSGKQELHGRGPTQLGHLGTTPEPLPDPTHHQTQLESLFADPQLVAGVREQRIDPENLLEGRQPSDMLILLECTVLIPSDGIPEGCRNTALSDPQGIQLKAHVPLCSCTFLHIRSTGISNPKTLLYHLPPP